MHVSKNEKEVLRTLVKYGLVPDVQIAKQLNITTQAVGKIKDRLEKKGVIKGYAPVLDYEKLGIRVYALALIKIKWDLVKNKTEEDIKEEMLKEREHLINMYSVQKNDVTHIALYGFRELSEVDRFFNSIQIHYKEIELKDIFIFSSASIIKMDHPTELLLKVIDKLPEMKLITIPT